MAKVELQLYVAGESLHSRLAIANLTKICDDDLEDECDVEVIDVDKDPPSLVSESFLATPMLVRRLPLPVHRVMLPKMPNSSKYKPSCIVADRDYE